MPSNSPSNRLITRRRSGVEISRIVESMQAGNLGDRAHWGAAFRPKPPRVNGGRYLHGRT